MYRRQTHGYAAPEYVETGHLYWVRQYPADSKKFSMIIDPLLRDQ
ncbi:hypothetical protein RchiOBHm_Chr7g0207251 [Rosa chinensis]|uniref:Uncharacterized protein n=1 Tax=Rosa chinensis TaxID=74649 RepID=A0A2P6P9F0_ROSCH|nr:hypothetical protein RchiOBHm_Chr7g0207251 [Rosa chinensis]